ncbi:hypothetical protein L7F22_018761, partial [Adiantum nelumboides]|nr:hypothetical protein [Adiantum nelumboides]
TKQKQNGKSPKGITLRSAFWSNRQILPEDGSSRVHAFASPKKHEKKSKCCVFIDGEVSVDRGSNITLPIPQSRTELTLPSIEDVPQIPVQQGEEGMDGEKADELSKHNRVFGFDFPLGLMNDFIKMLYLKREIEPPMVPLCRLITIDVVRLAIGDASWFISLFDQAGYVPTMESFIVLLKEENNKLRGMRLSNDEHKQKLDDVIKRMEEKLRDNDYKYLSIANPLHGEEFFSMLFKKDWSDKSMIGITKDKLYILCSTKITIDRCKELLHTMILAKLKDPKAMHFADYKKLRVYMRQEAYWQDFLKKHPEKATASRHKSISVLQEPTSKKKKKLSRKKVDFHTPVSDDNDEEESLASSPQHDIQESKSCGASKSIMSESIISRSKSENIFTYVDALLLEIESIDDFAWH